jgi:hypothetical protein
MCWFAGPATATVVTGSAPPAKAASGKRGYDRKVKKSAANGQSGGNTKKVKSRAAKAAKQVAESQAASVHSVPVRAAAKATSKATEGGMLSGGYLQLFQFWAPVRRISSGRSEVLKQMCMRAPAADCSVSAALCCHMTHILQDLRSCRNCHVTSL